MSEQSSEGLMGVCQEVRGRSLGDLRGRGVSLKLRPFIRSFLYSANFATRFPAGSWGRTGNRPVRERRQVGCRRR